MLLDNIKREARKKGITITKLEEAAGLSNGTIGKWSTSSPRIDNLRPIADYFGITIDDLLKEESPEEGEE